MCLTDFPPGPPDGRSAKQVEFRNITKFEGKNTIINEHPVVENYKSRGEDDDRNQFYYSRGLLTIINKSHIRISY